MTMQLYVNYSSVHLDFQTDGYTVLDGFFPETPDEGAESVTDQFVVFIRGSSPDDLRSKIGAVSLMIDHARRHKDDALAAWLYFSIDSSSPLMSKIINGMVMYDRNLDRNWRQNKAVLTVVIEHEPYWESSVEIQVPLTNRNGTDILTGLTVYNHKDADAGHDNFVQINPEDVLGDLPGRTRLELVNNFADATHNLNSVWVGQNWTDPDNLPHILEGESSTGGTNHAEASCSGGYYVDYSLPSGSEIEMFKWTLSSAFLDACKGQFYKILARFYLYAPTYVKFRFKLEYELTSVWQSGQFTLDPSRALLVRDLVTLQLPPWLRGQTNQYPLTLTLSGNQNTGNPLTIRLDFLQVTAIDGFRFLDCIGYGISQNQRLIDDGVSECFYVDDGSGNNKSGILVASGNPIVLYPGKKQKLYFLMHTNYGDIAEIDRTLSVKLFYRPRRRSV